MRVSPAGLPLPRALWDCPTASRGTSPRLRLCQFPPCLWLCPRCPWHSLHISSAVSESERAPQCFPGSASIGARARVGAGMPRLCVPGAATRGLLRAHTAGTRRVPRPWRPRAKPAGRAGVCSDSAPSRSSQHSVPPSPWGQNSPGCDLTPVRALLFLGDAEPGSAFWMVLLKVTDNVQAPP